MGSQGRPWFDLNELPEEEGDFIQVGLQSQGQPQIPLLHIQPQHFLGSLDGLPRPVNNATFSHGGSTSGFQPFIKVKDLQKCQQSMMQSSVVGGSDGPSTVETKYEMASMANDSSSRLRLLCDKNEASGNKIEITEPSKVETEKASKAAFLEDHMSLVVNNPPKQVEDATIKLEVEHMDALPDDREEGEWSDQEYAYESRGVLTDPSGENNQRDTVLTDPTGENNRRDIGNGAEKAMDTEMADNFLTNKGLERAIVIKEKERNNLAEFGKSVEAKICGQKLAWNNNLENAKESAGLGVKVADVDTKDLCCQQTREYAEKDTQSASSYLHSLEVSKVEAPQIDSGIGSTVSNMLTKAKRLNGNTESKYSSLLGKKSNRNEHKEAMLGKKRNRQTMLLDMDEAVRQAISIRSSTSKRLASPVSSSSIRIGKERSRSLHDRHGDKQDLRSPKDQKSVDGGSAEGMIINLFQGHNTDSGNSEDSFRVRSPNPDKVLRAQGAPLLTPLPRQTSLKQGMEQKQTQIQQPTGRKVSLASQSRESTEQRSSYKKPFLGKQGALCMTFQDTSVERLHREATSEKLWLNPGESELECVPGRFECAEEYVRVFEPLLFEECRAQLHSIWEELSDTVSRDSHIMVYVKNVDIRERGWYDVTVLPMHECKWTFKEGDVAVLSTPKPGTGRVKKLSDGAVSEDELETEVTGRMAGIVRRYLPVDIRDPKGAILHFYIGDRNESGRMVDDKHILRKFNKKGLIWYLTVLGSVATTQREYVALNAFHRLKAQMQNAILNPCPIHFPKNDDEPPAMPGCFKQPFVEHLCKSFNASQLTAIKWAGLHTAAGTNSVGGGKRQEPWPFTLVQGPPGTGKTHTVWGMLSVIHLVQFQHYYAVLLKKLAPESYKRANEATNFDAIGTGSIDEVLHSMDHNLQRTLPKLCPKPRMLVCAPSNAATDELLSRVLDRGFIDGEMKVYRPDVARVGVDTQSRAAQAVSVERRTEQLLGKGREEVINWMHQLRGREAYLSQKVNVLQKELSATAAAVRTQGNLGTDPEFLVAQDRNRDALLQQLAAIVEECDKVLVEMSRLLILESRFHPGSGFMHDEARSKLEASFANEAEIVFTTLSSSGRKLFTHLTHGFDMVVIDEAAQASEVAVLPPLSLGARCVLVGDPQQLPATVISRAAGPLKYSRSLFERFQQAGCPTILLSVQYRMHPQIRDFPSRYFYQGRLSDSESVANMQDEIYHKDCLLKPYLFYDVTHGRESHRGGSVSYQNVHEAQFALRLYEHLQTVRKSAGIGKIAIGIITPYKLQLKCLQQEFAHVLNTEEGKGLYINTVDAFQGQERDIIIMSCVRASKHGVGFVSDIRRMNVALTRARRALWVMGNATALMQSDDWAALIADAKERGCFVSMESLAERGFFVPRSPTFDPSLSRGSFIPRLPRPKGRPRQQEVLMQSSLNVSEMSNVTSSKNSTHRSSTFESEPSVDGYGYLSDQAKNICERTSPRKERIVENIRGNYNQASAWHDRNDGKHVRRSRGP